MRNYPTRPDRIYINGEILTMDDQNPIASALAISGDRFLNVGSGSELLKLAHAKTEVIDIKGKTITPGFMETHAHLSLYALTLLQVDCSTPHNSTIEDIKNKIKAKVRKIEPGQWIKGWGFDDTLIADQRHLSCSDLDECAPLNPVSLDHISGHLMYVNSKALEIAGIGSGSPSTPGGQVYRDSLGRPTGLLSEEAQALVSVKIPPHDPEELKNAILKAIQYFHACGITSTHDGSIDYYGEGREVLQAYQTLEKENQLHLRIYLTLMADFYGKILESGRESQLNSN
ncbi:MAG: amidohydrolase family protein, partial [Anaerolineales bacterium]|nr:amidohydrolase family protein [Anaerolineales bacterium]